MEVLGTRQKGRKALRQPGSGYLALDFLVSLFRVAISLLEKSVYKGHGIVNSRRY